MTYFSQASNAHVLSLAARARFLERLIARCKTGYFARLRSPEQDA
jgi:hypothetical protein